jgi:hypothetical protein
MAFDQCRIPQSQLAPWTRKHDEPSTPLVPQAPVVLFPQSLEDLICICQNRPPGQRLHTAGSHWSLSTAAVSDNTFIETHDWHDTVANTTLLFPVLGRTLREVVPGCLSENFLNALNAASAPPVTGPLKYYYHIQSGKRIYQLYAEMDVGDANEKDSLAALMVSQFKNNFYEGSWAFSTLGGAGGQTVVGALSTGTHGSDFDRPPIADSVVAVHIVTDGGKHYWIEGEQGITDKDKLVAHYGDAKFGGPGNFEVIYDDLVLQAARVQVGRFGIIYSVIIEVEEQYGLQQEISLTTWEDIQSNVTDQTSSLFVQALPLTSANSRRTAIPQRGLTIAINPIPAAGKHTCSVNRHWTIPLFLVPNSSLPQVAWPSSGNPMGRPERVGNILVAHDPILKAPRFSNAGASVSFGSSSGLSGLLNAGCADGNFLQGIIHGLIDDIVNLLENNAVTAGGVLAAALAVGGPLAPAVIAALLVILALLLGLLELLSLAAPSFGDLLNELANGLLSNPAIPRQAGILVWQAFANAVFQQQQSPGITQAISYAVMDGFNYPDVSCSVVAKSVEVFFDATDTRLLQFVNQVLRFESDQEAKDGTSVAGYVALRFMQKSNALLAPQTAAVTCSVECAGLTDVNGTTPFVDFAEQVALDPNINGILHWGQQNSSNQQQIEFRFGGGPGAMAGRLPEWRSVLSRLTDNGRLDGFSSAFTRQTGLEIVQPIITSLAVQTAPTAASPQCVFAWDCSHNPIATTVAIQIAQPSGATQNVAAPPLAGNLTFATPSPGTYTVTLTASLTVNGETNTASQTLNVPFA